jgi:hypothetical protein
MKLSGVSQNDYISSINLVRNILDIKNLIHLPTLCKEFGCPGMSNAVERCLAMYKKRYLDEMEKSKKDISRVDFSAPIYRVVAFYMTATYLKYKIDKNRLMQSTNCVPSQFKNVLASMKELCDMKNLVVTDSMNDIKERLVEKRKQTLDINNKSKAITNTVSSKDDSKNRSRIKRSREQCIEQELDTIQKEPKKLKQLGLNFLNAPSK